MTQKNVHVVPNGDQWKVEAEGGGASQLYGTQDEAIEAGTDLATQAKVELLVHGRDGQIRMRSSFGHDPRDRRG